MILYFLFRKEKGKIEKSAERTKVTDFVPSYLLIVMLVLLITVSFIDLPQGFIKDNVNGLLCCALLVIGLVYTFIKNKTASSVIEPLKTIDLETLGILLGLFLMIGGLKSQGVIDMIGQALASIGSNNTFLLYTVIVWFSVLISAFIDNIPYVATMLPIIASISATAGIDPTALYFGLLSGATLGGNLTPVGASANITGIGILRKAGYEVKNSDFFKLGIPFTLAAIIPAYIFVWLVFGI